MVGPSSNCHWPVYVPSRCSQINPSRPARTKARIVANGIIGDTRQALQLAGRFAYAHGR
jgi:hypothetical protein